MFCSWSGGKDTALALHEALAAGAVPRRLVTMRAEDGERSRSHGLRRAVLERQADAIGVPIRFGAASWATYEEVFRRQAAREAREGARAGVFGDIDLQEHREWEEAVCASAGLRAWLPLWGRDRAGLLEGLLAAGFRAMIVAVMADRLPPELLGRTLDRAVLDELERAGVDLAG